MQKWEYVIIYHDHRPLGPGIFQFLNGQKMKVSEAGEQNLSTLFGKLGEMGWELVTSHETGENFIARMEEHVFKRPF